MLPIGENKHNSKQDGNKKPADHYTEIYGQKIFWISFCDFFNQRK